MLLSNTTLGTVDCYSHSVLAELLPACAAGQSQHSHASVFLYFAGKRPLLLTPRHAVAPSSCSIPGAVFPAPPHTKQPAGVSQHLAAHAVVVAAPKGPECAVAVL